jgi:hypothetical protein
VQFGIKIDVATFEEGLLPDGRDAVEGTPLWTQPQPVHTIPLPMVEDTVEVAVYSMDAGPVLVAAIELVSPANKDRQGHRDAFVAKCETYLRQGVGLVIVDIVTSCIANLHQELLHRLKDDSGTVIDGQLHAAAYRPAGQNGQTMLEIWAEPLVIGATLPDMPLWIRGGPCVPVELEVSYERTCLEQRMM